MINYFSLIFTTKYWLKIIYSCKSGEHELRQVIVELKLNHLMSLSRGKDQVNDKTYTKTSLSCQNMVLYHFDINFVRRVVAFIFFTLSNN